MSVTNKPAIPNKKQEKEEPADIVDEENESADNGENKRKNNEKMNINIH
jgi:hypothetical protein